MENYGVSITVARVMLQGRLDRWGFIVVPNTAQDGIRVRFLSCREFITPEHPLNT